MENNPSYIVRQTRGLPMGTNCTLLTSLDYMYTKLNTLTRCPLTLSAGAQRVNEDYLCGILGSKDIEWKPYVYLDFCVFGKLDELDFSVIQFPHADSNAAEYQFPGIVTC